MKTFLILPITALLLSFHFVSMAQNCPLVCPENIIAKADSATGGTYINFPAIVVSGNCPSPKFTPASGSFFQIGSSSVIVTTESGERCSFTVTVTDNEPPVLSPVTLSLKRLWPANGRMRDVAVHYITADNSNETSCTVTVSSNDSSLVPDYEIIDAHSIRLRALRLPNGMPRVYTVTVTCTDEAGNVTTRTTGISVAKNVDGKR
jgi:hypothetical protein